VRAHSVSPLEIFNIGVPLEEDADERVWVKGLVNAHEWKEILRKSRR
jgi:hypothetical protein